MLLTSTKPVSAQIITVSQNVPVLLTNFIVIPAATLILYLSLLVLVIPQLAFLLVYVVGGLNSTLTKIAQLPGASIEGLNPTLTQTVLIYVVILALYVLLRLRLSRHPLRLSRR